MRYGLFRTLGLNKKNFSGNFILIIAILVLSILTVTPIYYTAKYMMIYWAIFFIFALGYVKKTNVKIRHILLLAVIFVLICVLYKLLGVSSAVLGYCITNPFVYFAPVMALAIIDRCGNESQIRFLLHFISLAVAINVLDSIRLTYTLGIENMAYQQFAGILAEEGISGLNLGGSLFVNMVVFYANVMFFAFLKTKNGTEKILFLLYFIISAYFIIMCSLKGSAVVLLLVSIALQFISNRGGLHFNRIVVFTVIAFLFFSVFRDNIIYFLISIIGSNRIADRLIVFTTTASVADSGTFMARERLWLVSVHSWLQNIVTFFFGIGDHNWNEFSTTDASGIGNHADLFDVLGRYGLVGGVVLYSSIKIYYDYLKEKFGSLFKFEIISFLILIILMGTTKKFVAGEPAIVIFILFPLCLKYFYRDNKKTQICN